VWFQQDGATAHTARIAMRGLNEMFPAHMISRRGNIEWPARLPDLNAYDFFFCGYLKSKVYEKKRKTTDDLKQNIREEVAAIPPTLLQRVMQNFQKRLQECVDNIARHLTDTIFRKRILQLKCLEIKLTLAINSLKKIVPFSFYFNFKIVRFFCRTLY
jgi:hypothetical protein